MKGSAEFLIFCCFVAVSSAIHCFDCNSYNDPACADPFKNSTSLTTVDCDTKSHPQHIDVRSTFCRKITQRGRNQHQLSYQQLKRFYCFIVNGEIRVIRTCGYIEGRSNKNKCERISISNANEMRYCECDANLCNSAKSHKIEIFVCGLLGMLMIIANKIFL